MSPTTCWIYFLMLIQKIFKLKLKILIGFIEFFCISLKIKQYNQILNNLIKEIKNDKNGL